MAAVQDPIRVLLVDDQTLFRQGVSALINSQHDMEVVGDGLHWREALNRVIEFQPQVVLLETRLGGCSTFQILRRLKAQAGTLRVLVFTTSSHEEDLVQAIRNGADGYLVKDMPPEDLFRSIRDAAAGSSVVSSHMTGKLFRELVRQEVRQKRLLQTLLTGVERNILEMVVKGSSYRDISSILYMSESAVRYQVRNILQRFGCGNRVQLAIFALQEGLVPDPAMGGMN